MKILCISDLHLDWITQGVSRYEEIAGHLQSVLKTVEQEGVDLVIFAGDMCDPDTGTVVFRALKTMGMLLTGLKERGVRWYCVAGNHDVIEDGTGTTTLSPLMALGGDTSSVFNEPGVVQTVHNGKSYLFVMLPFTATSHPYNPADYMPKQKARFDKVIVVSHLTVPGIVPGEEVTDMPRGREVLFPVANCGAVDLVIQGHYHRRQLFMLPGDVPMQVVGSMVNLTFGEVKNRPGYIIVEV